MSNNTTQNLSNYDTPQNVGEHPDLILAKERLIVEEEHN